MCSFAFAFGMGLVCYFIGFFFGIMSRKFSRAKNEEPECYEDVVKRDG